MVRVACMSYFTTPYKTPVLMFYIYTFLLFLTNKCFKAWYIKNIDLYTTFLYDASFVEFVEELNCTKSWFSGTSRTNKNTLLVCPLFFIAQSTIFAFCEAFYACFISFYIFTSLCSNRRSFAGVTRSAAVLAGKSSSITINWKLFKGIFMASFSLCILNIKCQLMSII